MDKLTITDLTLTLAESLQGVRFEPVRSLETDGWNAQTLHLYSHTGTHMDAPVHFGISERSIDQISLADCQAMCHVIDVRSAQPGGLITIGHLGPVADSFRAGEGLLFWSGFSQYAHNHVVYRRDIPRIERQLALWCVQRGAKIVGVEGPSVADVNNLDELTTVHRILLGGGITVVEGLTALDTLASSPVWFWAVPLKIEKGDGSPCRAFAIEKKN